LLTIVVLILLDPSYTTAYISVNYEIVLIYIIAALTLLYCIVSIVMYAIMQKRSNSDNRPTSLTNCALTKWRVLFLYIIHKCICKNVQEVIFCGAGMIGWMLVCGIGGTISQRTIIDTGEVFGWMAACAGIIVALFLGILALFCLNIMNEKILNPRSNKYGSQYQYGSRL
ncbi:unnamed protein product, partial [Dracunculus medinensis]|uniref:G_PROTEIN_RECEP_F1_2 domain-containing protein n=1 Tax=Dracunculus medinensis TaxID=318479 RepID=A0A158Q4Y7_DRAME